MEVFQNSGLQVMYRIIQIMIQRFKIKTSNFFHMIRAPDSQKLEFLCEWYVVSIITNILKKKKQ